jgi:hypothetical protein
MAPSGFSPTKHEEKLAMLSHIQEHPGTHYGNFQQRATYYNPYIEMGHLYLQAFGGNDDPSPKNQVEAWEHSIGDIAQSGFLQHPTPEPRAFDTDNGLLQPKDSGPRTNSNSDFTKPDPAACAITVKVPSAIEDQPLQLVDTPRAQKSETILRTSYDRHSEMQSYITTTTQKATAKNTQTFLHNLDLHDISEAKVKSNQQQPEVSYPLLQWEEKMQPNRVSDIIPWEVMPPAASQKYVISKFRLSSKLSAESIETLARVINNPAPGMTLSDLDDCTETGQQPDKINEPTEESFSWPLVGSDEWLELKPPTPADRERIRKLMAKAAAEVTNVLPEPLFKPYQQTSSRSNLISSAQAWFHEDKRGVRASALGLVEQNLIKARYEAGRRNGGLVPAKFNDGCAANLLVMEVAMNIKSYFDREIPVEKQRGNFFKVRAVPEYAIEKGGLLTGLSQSVSYFDDNQEGFGVAPVRIARDPRFRHGTDGGKIRSEEEWRHRNELYGRKLYEAWKCM